MDDRHTDGHAGSVYHIHTDGHAYTRTWYEAVSRGTTVESKLQP